MTGQYYVKGRVKCEATNFARLAELIDESKYPNRNMKCLLFVNKILLRGRTTICNSYFDNVMTKFMINNKDRRMQNRQIESKKTTTEIIDVTRRKERYFAPAGDQVEHHNYRNRATCMHRNRNPCNSCFMVNRATGMDRGRVRLTTTTTSRNMAATLQLIPSLGL